MGYERFIFWFWKSSTTAWHACKVKNTLIVLYAFIFTLFAQRLPTIRSTIHFSKPLLCETLICCDWSISSPVMPDKAAFVSAVLLVYSVTGETTVFTATSREWIYIFILTNTKRPTSGSGQHEALGIRFKNDSFQWFRVESFFRETITLYTVHFQIQQMFSFT